MHEYKLEVAGGDVDNDDVDYFDDYGDYGDYDDHTSYLSFFLHSQNFWIIKFTPKEANFLR